MFKKEVGKPDVIQGTLDGIQQNIWAMMAVGYTMKMMTTGSNLVTDDSCKTTNYKWIESLVEAVDEFIYPLPLDVNFQYWHAVDDHNNL